MEQLKRDLAEPLNPELREQFEKERVEEEAERFRALIGAAYAEEQAEKQKRWPRPKRLRASQMTGS